MKAANRLALLVAAIAVVGCAGPSKSVKSREGISAKIITSPAGAKVIGRAREKDVTYLKVLGLTPHKIEALMPISVMVHKAGYLAAPVRVASGTAVLELTLGPTGMDPLATEIWVNDAFQGEPIEWADETLRRRAFVSDFPDTSPEVAEAILAGRLVRGMTSLQVKASRGKPTSAVTVYEGDGSKARWTYADAILVFEDDSLESWK